jgi:N-dimethylarginine dimethylaminohydrolase
MRDVNAEKVCFVKTRERDDEGVEAGAYATQRTTGSSAQRAKATSLIGNDRARSELAMALANAAPSGGPLLMCPPDYYGVDYVINPWMETNVGGIQHPLAVRQWEGLRALLSAVIELRFAPPSPGWPDMVFTANAGLAIGGRVVVSRFRFGERRGEERLFEAWFLEQGFDVAPWPQDVLFEGAGDALFDRDRALIWSGYGFRTGPAASPLIERIFDRQTVSLRLVDPRFYHLDTCLCPLPEGRLMYYPPAFDEASRKKIASIVAPCDRIEVGEEDALAFACNAIEADRRIFLNAASKDLHARLSAAGFKVAQTPLSEFMKAGGAAKCLTLKLGEG